MRTIGAMLFFGGGYLAISYLGYLLNRKPGETFKAFLRERSSLFDPILDSLRRSRGTRSW